MAEHTRVNLHQGCGSFSSPVERVEFAPYGPYRPPPAHVAEAGRPVGISMTQKYW